MKKENIFKKIGTKIVNFVKDIVINLKRKKIIKRFDADKDVLFLDPAEDYDSAIVGVSEDKLHLIYDYDKMCEQLSNNYSEYYHKHPEKLADIGEDGNNPDDVDYFTMAVEWIEFNTIRSIPYYYANNGPMVRYVDYENEGKYRYSNEEDSEDE